MTSSYMQKIGLTITNYVIIISFSKFLSEVSKPKVIKPCFLSIFQSLPFKYVYYVRFFIKLYFNQSVCQFLQFSIKQLRMNRSSTSPFRATSSTIGRQGLGGQSADALIRTLEMQNNALVQQINILKAKGKKMTELEDKIDMILRHNTQLLNENQRLAKLINQKKSQTQIWKNKHDNLLANRSTASDLEVKRLLNQIQKLKEESCQIEHAKNLQINEIKNQQNLELQNLKRNNLGSAEKYELEIRKLKQYCDKKDYEMSDLKMKIARMGKQTDFEIGKLREEKERLRNDLQFEQAEHRKEVQSLKSKFDYNFHSEIENLKKQHLNQIQTLDYENSKLKEVINSKNMQLEQAMIKQSKMRNHFEDSIQLLKKENVQLKEKLVENEHISDLELNNLRQKLDSIKESQLELLKNGHANQVDILNRQISKLHRFLDSRNEQIENISKQRSQMRQTLEAEILKCKASLEAQLNQNNQFIQKHEEVLKIHEDELKFKNEQSKTMENYFKSQIETYKKQKETADSLLRSKEKQLENERRQARESTLRYEEELRVIKEQCNQSKDQQERIARRSNADSQDLKKVQQLKVKQLESKITALEQQNRKKDGLIGELKENISNLDREIKLSDEKIQFLENTEKELRNQMKENFSRWDAKQKQLNVLITTTINKMNKSKSTQIQELKSIHDNKTRTLKHQIEGLQRLVEEKNKILNSLKSKYEQLVNNFEKQFAREAARKNLDIKVPGWLPETLALKSLFDVFLKNKVLEYCS